MLETCLNSGKKENGVEINPHHYFYLVVTPV